jgi:hypothetical protein
MSDALKECDGIDWIRKRHAVPGTSRTFAFNRDPEKVRRADRIEGGSDLQTWFGGPQSIELCEDVIAGLAATGGRSPCFTGSSSPMTRTKMKMKMKMKMKR